MYHAQVHPQHQVAERVAVDPQVLPGHEVHVDLAPLVFISKGRRDNLLEDTKHMTGCKRVAQWLPCLGNALHDGLAKGTGRI